MFKKLLKLFGYQSTPPQEQPCLLKSQPVKKPSVKTSAPKRTQASPSNKQSPSRTASNVKPRPKAKPKAKSNVKTTK